MKSNIVALCKRCCPEVSWHTKRSRASCAPTVQLGKEDKPADAHNHSTNKQSTSQKDNGCRRRADFTDQVRKLVCSKKRSGKCRIRGNDSCDAGGRMDEGDCDVQLVA